MAELALPFEAEIVHDLPDDLAAAIGHAMVKYARLEHALTMLIALLLQLNKTEARIALREPRAADRLDIALDLFAIKGIAVRLDVSLLKGLVTETTSGRDLLGHGIWLRHPETGQLYVRQTKGKWPKNLSKNETVKRSVFPQAFPYSADECRKTIATVEKALSLISELGAELDDALRTFPERFREPSPLLNPLGIQTRKDI